MSLEVQGTFVSEKVSKVRWIPEEYEEATCFVTGSWDNDENYVRVWKWDRDPDPESALGTEPKVTGSIPVSGDVAALTLAGSGLAVTATTNGDITILQLPNLTTKHTFSGLHCFKDGTPSPCTDISLLDDCIATVGEDGRLNLLLLHQHRIVRTIEKADSCSIHSVCFLKHNEVITGNLRGQMKIWDLRSHSNSPSSSFILCSDQVTATCIVHHPTQRHLVLAGNENGSLAVWDLRINTYPASLLNAHSSAICEIQFHPDHPQRLFTCSANGEIWHWNTTSMAKQITTTSTMSLNESTINPWLMNDEDKANLEISSLMSDLHKSINSLDCNKNRVICGCDNEAVYIINNIFT